LKVFRCAPGKPEKRCEDGLGAGIRGVIFADFFHESQKSRKSKNKGEVEKERMNLKIVPNIEPTQGKSRFYRGADEAFFGKARFPGLRSLNLEGEND